ncbi:DNA-processing protein DprA [Stenotrophomonas acidaminiphila]|uniref:DNA-processing protein DprA n=1 Tax=Stenotrophomonas TaxID=40323 RepID=UPI0028AFFBC5|nr:DNA-processing protein DprA [Stenotrophomonas acidaminiphila]
MAFTERNVTMSAITKATTIVQAGDTSGTLIQARAALEQGRKLFILESCYRTRRSLGPTCTRKRARTELRISTRFEKYLDVLNKLSKDDRLMVGDHYHPNKHDEVWYCAESTPGESACP